MQRLSDKDLGIIVLYSRELSRLVSPAEATRNGLPQFDGATCDLLKDLGYALIYGEDFTIENDSFYKPIVEDMKKELSEMYKENF